MLGFLAGIVLGGLVSWAITHTYAAKQGTDPQYEVVLLTRVRVRVEEVWEFVSNPENFQHFCHNHSEPFGHKNIRKGASFRTISNVGPPYTQFVVDWEPPFVFSWGPVPDAWSYKICLTDRGDETEVSLTRRFRIPEWWEVLLGAILRNDPRKNHEALASETLSSLASTLRARKGD